jgi:hypothetical protein
VALLCVQVVADLIVLFLEMRLASICEAWVLPLGHWAAPIAVSLLQFPLIARFSVYPYWPQEWLDRPGWLRFGIYLLIAVLSWVHLYVHSVAIISLAIELGLAPELSSFGPRCFDQIPPNFPFP